jgi:hypothetical protein
MYNKSRQTCLLFYVVRLTGLLRKGYRKASSSYFTVREETILVSGEEP